MEPSGAKARPSRAERGRSGRRHRRDSGVSTRALSLIQAAPLGPWRPAVFSQFCNLLKEAPAEALDVQLEVRSSGVRGAGRTSLLESMTFAVLCARLRGGGLSFGLHDVGSETQREDFLASLSLDEAAAAEGGSRLWWSRVVRI